MNTMKLLTLLCVSAFLAAANAEKKTKAKYGIEPALLPTSWIPVSNDSSRIINGVDAVQGENPWQITLQVGFNDQWFHICGATLIDTDKALTAAHCLIYWGQLEHRVGLGYYDLSVGPATPNSQTIAVSDVTIHEQWDGERSGFPSDIAILRFAEPAVLTDSVQTLAMPDFNEDFDFEICGLTGWGISSTDGQSPAILQYAPFTIVPYQDCRKFWSVADTTIFSFRHICAFNYPSSVCSGDSGGPLVCRDKLAGIVSWGDSTCSGCFPGVYVRVSSYFYWLRLNL